MWDKVWDKMNFKKTLTTNIIVALIILAIVSGGLAFLGFDVSRRADEAQKFQEQLTYYSQRTQSLSLLTDDYDNAQPYLVKLDALLVTENDLIRLVNDLGLMASQSQIKNFSVKPGAGTPKSGDKLGETAVSISMQSSLDNLVNFLKIFLGSRYFTRVSAIEINGQDGNNFNTTLSGKVFSF